MTIFNFDCPCIAGLLWMLVLSMFPDSVTPDSVTASAASVGCKLE